MDEKPPGAASPASDEGWSPSDPSETSLLLAQLLDPDLHLPERPVFVEDLMTFEMPDGLGVMFRGGEAPALLRGQLVAPSLAYLRDALDGHRTLLEVVRGVPEGLPASAVARTLLILHSKGVIARLEPTPAASGAARSDHRERLFWGRHLAITRSAATATELLDRASSARIAVMGDGLFVTVVTDLLTRSGFTNLVLVDTPSGTPVQREPDDTRLARLGEALDGTELLVTATVDASRALLLGVNDLVVRSRTAWLMANWDGSTVDIGPLVHPGETACYECVLLRQASTDALAIENALYQDALAATGQQLRGEALWPATLVAGLVTAEVARAVTGVAPPTLTDAVLRVQPVSGVLVRGEVARVPRCPACYDGPIPATALPETVGVE